MNGVIDTGSTVNEFSTDWLFSYRPVPGTLVYLGYGSTLNEPREFRFQDLQRTRDGFFGKISYLFRLSPPRRGANAFSPQGKGKKKNNNARYLSRQYYSLHQLHQ